MDSFYDAPRRPPAPITRDTLATVPVVPEISVLCSSNGPRNIFTPYSEWKNQHTIPQHNYNGSNKENISAAIHNAQNNSILKKQVRFESPKLQQQLSNDKSSNYNESVKIHKSVSQNKVQQTPSFEQMYMANIPNRHLDLSIIDVPKKSSETVNNRNNVDRKTETIIKEKIISETYKEFLENQKSGAKIVLNDSVTDIFNYKGNITNKNSLISEANPLHKLKPFQDVICGTAILDGHITPSVMENIFPQKSRGISGTSANHSFQPTGTFQTQTSPTSKQSPCEVQDFKEAAVYKTNPNLKAHRKMENYAICNLERNRDCENFEKDSALGYNSPSREYPDPINKGTTAFPCGCSNSAKHQEDNSLKPKNEDDFSTKDLLKIIAQQSQQIAQQNNQLLLLQQQVSELISMQKNNVIYRQKSIDMGQSTCYCHNEKPVFPTKSDCCKRTASGSNIGKYDCLQDQKCFGGGQNLETVQDRCITSTKHEVANDNEQKFLSIPKNNKNQCVPNFSIGLTTSFEVSFKRPPYRNQNEFLQKNTGLQDSDTEPVRIEEITENKSNQNDRNYKDNSVEAYRDKCGTENDNNNKETLVDTSIVFKEPICVREPCPSPEPSIKINMNDFDDSDSDDDNSEVEVSFYKNLMTQINKILHKAQIETAEQIAYNSTSPNLNHWTMHKVKEATLKHLRKIGVDLPNFDDSSPNSSSSEETDGRSYDQDDISFAVKQLLMKYLPADHLAKLAAREDRHDDRTVSTPKEKIGPIKNRPEFSFATVQYMKKYNLITNGRKDYNHQPQKMNPAQSPKILDITKLKQQPKLL